MLLEYNEDQVMK